MKKVQLLFFSVFATLSVHAQLNGDGYYRVQNQKTTRYISIMDNRGSVNAQTTDVDLGALRTVTGFERVVSDPASIFYVKKRTKGYDIQSQGTSTYAMTKRELLVRDMKDGTYMAYATESGVTKYLCDNIPSWMLSEEEKIYGAVCTNEKDARNWYINPIRESDGYYFGISPDVAVDGAYYKSFYASFPFSILSSGMSAFIVTKIDSENGCVVVKEVSGDIAGETPLIMKCSSAQPADNKLNLLTSNVKKQSDNLLTGVYFCNPNAGKHTNVVDYSSFTMRVLGKSADGSLAFVKQTGLKYVPANSAYLTVPAMAPDVLKIYSENEYNQLLAEKVTVTAKSTSREYGEANPDLEYDTEGGALKGEPTLTCMANEQSPVGKYDINVSAGSVTNGLATFVKGVLTVTPAELTVSVADATKEEGEENPDFVISYSGFKNGETESVLLVKPTVTTTATIDSPAGEYDLVVAGGSARNYTFTYVAGKLTITPKPIIDGVAAVTKERAFDVYDMYGRKLCSNVVSLSGLPKGIYLVNGRKVMVK